MQRSTKSASASPADTGWHDGNLEQRDATAQHELLLVGPSPSRPLFPSFSPFSLSNLGCYRGNAGTGHRRVLRRPPERREMEGNEKGRLFSTSLGLPAVSVCPSLISFLLFVDQMFEKINKTLPADTFLRLVFFDVVSLLRSFLPSPLSLSLFSLFLSFSLPSLALFLSSGSDRTFCLRHISREESLQ